LAGTSIDDLSGTTVKNVGIDLAEGLNPGSSLVVNGTPNADSMTVANAKVFYSTAPFVSLAWGKVAFTPSAGASTLFLNGFGGDDNLFVSSNAELGSTGVVIDGGEGDDILSADATLLGGPGNDTFIVPVGANSIDGGSGADTILIQGSEINDVLTIEQTDAPGLLTTVVISTRFGPDPSQTSTNSVQNVELIKVLGQAGEDSITFSGTGIIRVDAYGGYGNDDISGCRGFIHASALITAYGEQGQDTIRGGANNDDLFGGDDSDVFNWSAGDGDDTIDGGTGYDSTGFKGTPGTDCFLLSFNGTYAAIGVDAFGTFGETSLAADVENIMLIGIGGADAYTVSSLAITPVKIVDIIMGGDGSANIASVQLPNVGAYVNATPSIGLFSSVDVNGLSALLNIRNSSPVDTLDIIGGYGHDQIEIPVETLALISVQADGMGGNDLIRGAQTAMGGSGDDTIFGTDGNDALLGGLGKDQIEGLIGADLILGDGTATGVAAGVPGNNGPGIPAFVIDVYSPLGGNDTILGGDGADTINGGAGNDSIDGGDGADTIGVLIAALNPILPSGFLEPGNDLITGGLGDDSIQAGDGNDSVFGNEGQDLIAGQAGNDTIDGGTCNDTIFGNEDNDSILGGDGKDTIDGGAGDDYIAGNNDEDSILGAAGADTIDGGDAADIIFGSDGSDSILGGLGNDTIDGGLGNDSIAGNAGDDSILGGDGNDTIDGGDGNDVIQGNAGDDSILGGLGLDSIHGGLGADFIRGDEGNDSLCGGPDDSEKVDPSLDGSDTVFGGSGNDAINGDAGDDFLNGGVGNDQLWGNDGNDTIGVFVYNGVTQFEPGNDSMIGGLGDDLIAGALVDAAGKPVNDGNDVMFGQEGNDTIWGGAGGDMIYGGEGDDVMLGGTPLTANTLHAPRNGKLPNDGNDTMFGGNGFDKVDGGNNNNLLDAGNDGIRETVLGGKGNDMGYNHTLQDSVNFDVLALDGGFNHKFCDGGLEEPPVPAASCTYIAWAIPSNYFTGVKTLKNGDIVEHPSMDYRTKPNNGPNGPVTKTIKIESSKAAVTKTTLVKSAVSKSSTSFAGKSKTVGKLSSGLGKLQVAKG